MKDKKLKNNQEFEELKNKCDEYLAGWQRAKADYANYQREMEDKLKNLASFSKTALLTEIIPILDNFAKAVDHVPAEQQNQAWVMGVFQIKKQLEDFLANNGLEKITTIGEKFDHHLHEAAGKEKVTDKDPDIIIKEISSGYKLNGQVIIPAKVIVTE